MTLTQTSFLFRHFHFNSVNNNKKTTINFNIVNANRLKITSHIYAKISLQIENIIKNDVCAIFQRFFFNSHFEISQIRPLRTFNNIKSRLFGLYNIHNFHNLAQFPGSVFRVRGPARRVNHFSRCIACHRCLKNASYTIRITVCFRRYFTYAIRFFTLIYYVVKYFTNFRFNDRALSLYARAFHFPLCVRINLA